MCPFYRGKITANSLLGFATLHILANYYQPLKWALYAKESMVQHSSSTKIMAYICAVILLPVYTLGPLSMIYLSTKRIADGDWQTLLFLICICATLVYFCGKYFLLMLRFLKTLRVSFTFDSKGIVLQQDGSSTFYPWSDLSKSKEYGSCQIYCLIDSSGNHLFSIWKYADSYQEFREEAYEQIGI